MKKIIFLVSLMLLISCNTQDIKAQSVSFTYTTEFGTTKAINFILTSSGEIALSMESTDELKILLIVGTENIRFFRKSLEDVYNAYAQHYSIIKKNSVQAFTKSIYKIYNNFHISDNYITSEYDSYSEMNCIIIKYQDYSDIMLGCAFDLDTKYTILLFKNPEDLKVFINTINIDKAINTFKALNI